MTDVRWIRVLCTFAAGAWIACGAAVAEDQSGGVALQLDETALPDEALNDPQIVEVTRLVNEGEMQAGWIALVKATTPEAAEYARRMVTEHLDANLRLRDLSRSEGTGTATSATSALLLDRALEVVTLLEATDGRDFDLVYLESQVELHAAALLLVDTRLLPQAENAAVREYLTALRPAVQEHLDEAERRLAEVGGSTAPAATSR
jgi:putative membrane protein